MQASVGIWAAACSVAMVAGRVGCDACGIGVREISCSQLLTSGASSWWISSRQRLGTLSVRQIFSWSRGWAARALSGQMLRHQSWRKPPIRMTGKFPNTRWQTLAKGSLHTWFSAANKRWESRHKAHPGSTKLCVHGFSVIVQMRSCWIAKAHKCSVPTPWGFVWKPNMERYQEDDCEGWQMCTSSPPYLRSKISSVSWRRNRYRRLARLGPRYLMWIGWWASQQIMNPVSAVLIVIRSCRKKSVILW